MKKTTSLLSLAILFAMSFILTSSINTPTKYVFDAAASKVTWTSTAEDGKTHTGSLDFKSGTLMFDVKTLQSGFSYINMQSLTCKDVTDAGFNRELITEMRSESELDVVKFKETTFKIVKAKRLDVAEGQPNYDIDALLKLKGIDIPVKFIATIVMKKSDLSFKSDFVIPKATAKLPYDLKLVFDINASIAK